MVNLKIANTLELILAVLYGPNKDDPNFYENLKGSLKHNEELPLIICGDWNLVLNYSLDTFGYVQQNNKNSYCKVEELKTVFNLTDPWRYTYLNERKYTWFSAKAPKQMARLGFFLLSSDLIPLVTNSGMYTGYRTDHSLVYLYINIRIS